MKLAFMYLLLFSSVATSFLSCSKESDEHENSLRNVETKLIPSLCTSSNGDTITFIYEGNTNRLVEVRNIQSRNNLRVSKLTYVDNVLTEISMGGRTSTISSYRDKDDFIIEAISPYSSRTIEQFVFASNPRFISDEAYMSGYKFGIGAPGWQGGSFKNRTPDSMVLEIGGYYGNTIVNMFFDGKNGIFKNIYLKYHVALANYEMSFAYPLVQGKDFHYYLINNYLSNKIRGNSDSILTKVLKYNEEGYPIELLKRPTSTSPVTWHIEYKSFE